MRTEEREVHRGITVFHLKYQYGDKFDCVIYGFRALKEVHSIVFPEEIRKFKLTWGLIFIDFYQNTTKYIS